MANPTTTTPSLPVERASGAQAHGREDNAMSAARTPLYPTTVITVRPTHMYEQFSRCIHGDAECW